MDTVYVTLLTISVFAVVIGLGALLYNIVAFLDAGIKFFERENEMAEKEEGHE